MPEIPQSDLHVLWSEEFGAYFNGKGSNVYEGPAQIFVNKKSMQATEEFYDSELIRVKVKLVKS